MFFKKELLSHFKQYQILVDFVQTAGSVVCGFPVPEYFILFLFPTTFISLFCPLISVFKLCRSYGRAPKMIHLESNFVQFKEELLPKEGNKALLTFPFLHIYWTECCVSTWKNSNLKIKLFPEA